MAVFTFSDIDTELLELLVSNVSTDIPVPAAERARAINEAYAVVFEASGGTLTPANHATLWTPSPAVTGTQTLAGALTSIGEIVHLWVGTTVGSTGASSGDTELERVELSQIQWLRTNSSSTVGLGTYAESKLYAVSKAATTTPGNVNKFTVEVWPASAGTRYYPAHYIPQFTAIDSATVTTPDLNDLQSRDIAPLAAWFLAPRIDRNDLVPMYAMKLSESTRKALERKMSSMVDARQDK